MHLVKEFIQDGTSVVACCEAALWDRGVWVDVEPIGSAVPENPRREGIL